jgi:hypothetical protein
MGAGIGLLARQMWARIVRRRSLGPRSESPETRCDFPVASTRHNAGVWSEARPLSLAPNQPRSVVIT